MVTKSKPVAIEVRGLGKTFRLPRDKSASIKSATIRLFRRRGYEIQHALEGVNFNIKAGEFFGIVGRNGSGKSTLLKILAGIYPPTKGEVKVNGQVTAFIELGVGFNPELTGRENVYLNGALLGFSRAEMRAKYDEIVSFAELERFMDQKLKNYSSGMQVRLAFSIAVRAESDILLIDEVLAVGDERFQNKCMRMFEQIKNSGRTVVFVSHNMDQVKQFCDRAIVIHDGKLIFDGSANEAARRYVALNFPEAATNTKYQKGGLKVKLVKVNGQPAQSSILNWGDRATLSLEWPPSGKVKNAGVAIYNSAGQYIFGANTILDKAKIGKNRVNYEIELNVSEGDYVVQVGLFGETDSEKIYFVDKALSFKVLPSDNWQGVSHLKHEWVA